MSVRPETVSKPVPIPDDHSQPFFEGAKRHVLMIERCMHCGAFQVPGRFACDQCLSSNLEWVEVSGFGTVFTYIIMHQRYHPAFVDELPYNVAVVELDEGPRMVSNVVGIENQALYVGMPVRVMFEDLTKDISIPKFQPRDRDSQS